MQGLPPMQGRGLRVTGAPMTRASNCPPKQWPSPGMSDARACLSSAISCAIQARGSFTLRLLPSSTSPLKSRACSGTASPISGLK